MCPGRGQSRLQPLHPTLRSITVHVAIRMAESTACILWRNYNHLQVYIVTYM